MTEIIPTIFAKSKEEFKSKYDLLKDIVPKIHIDVGDGEFIEVETPNLDKIKDIKIECEFHLMVKKPSKYLKVLTKFKTKLAYVHLEIFENKKECRELIEKFNKNGIDVGFVINPNSRVEDYIPYYHLTNKIMIMSVQPGKQGQKFLDESLEKIHLFKTLNPKLHIQLDGGINETTSKKAILKGVNSLAVGSYISSAKNPENSYFNLCKLSE